MTVQPPSYEQLIQEVFIDPIRSVVVVDDKFPTLEGLLAAAARKGDLPSTADFDVSWEIDKAQGIVQFCHSRERPWLVEFHDGQPPLEGEEAAIADHLSQSDLMILDYHLDPRNPDDGTAAIEILRRIALNDHFNLVLVYTRGSNDAAGDIERVWREIVIGLSTAASALSCDSDDLATARSVIEELEEQDESFTGRVRGAIDDQAYLSVRKDCMGVSWNWSELLQKQRFLAPFQAALGQAITLSPDDKVLVLRWALHERQESLQDKLSRRNLGQLLWQFDGTSQVNWVRTDRLFLTVVSKREEPAELPELLCKALRGWRPEPHRLLMSRMRTVLAEVGVQAEDEVLANRHLQKAWFNDLQTPDPQESRWKIQATVARQWERLGDALGEAVGEYGEKLSAWLLTNPEEARADVLFRGLSEEDVRKHRNCYVCSKPVAGHHLMTGHVIETANHLGAPEKWLCLSPACDLVPRPRKGWHERLTGYIPFIAVELHADDNGWKDATRGNHVFLKLDNQVECYRFTPGKTDAAPRWEQMLAHRQGFCHGESELKINRISVTQGTDEVIVTPSSARIVAQLRYEYALNLLNKLGATLSRVGLDFE
jgi:hypothetical protein